MLALVLFDDGVYYICKDADISTKGESCSIRYKGSRYAGTVIAVNVHRAPLTALKAKLEEESDDDSQHELNSDSQTDPSHVLDNRSNLPKCSSIAEDELAAAVVVSNSGSNSTDPKQSTPLPTRMSFRDAAQDEELATSKSTLEGERVIIDSDCRDNDGVKKNLAVDQRAEVSTVSECVDELQIDVEDHIVSPQGIADRTESVVTTSDPADEYQTIEAKSDHTSQPAPPTSILDVAATETEKDKPRIVMAEIGTEKRLEKGEKHFVYVKPVDTDYASHDDLAGVFAEESTLPMQRGEKNNYMIVNLEDPPPFAKPNTDGFSQTLYPITQSCEQGLKEPATGNTYMDEDELAAAVVVSNFGSNSTNPKQSTPLPTRMAFRDDAQNEELATSKLTLEGERLIINIDCRDNDSVKKNLAADQRAVVSTVSECVNELQIDVEDHIVSPQGIVERTETVVTKADPADEHQPIEAKSDHSSQPVPPTSILNVGATETEKDKPRIVMTEILTEKRLEKGEKHFVYVKPVVTDYASHDDLAKVFAEESILPMQSGEKNNYMILNLDDPSCEQGLKESATGDSYMDDIIDVLNENQSFVWVNEKLTVYASEPNDLISHSEELSNLNGPEREGIVLNSTPTRTTHDVTITNTRPEAWPTDPISSNEGNDTLSDAGSCSSGSSYAPDSNSSDESAAEDRERPICDDTRGQLTISANASTDLDASLAINKVGHSAPDDTDMFVRNVESGMKKDFCIYCHTEQGKLSRHVARQHSTEEDVAKFLSFEKGSDERKIIMAKIRKRGQFFFNTNRAVNTGERKVVRRPKARYNRVAADWVVCPACGADYHKNGLARHYKRCTDKTFGGRRNIRILSKKIAGRIHPKACDILRTKVFPTMHEDAVVKAIRYDELIILFANKLCQKYKDPHFYDMIRQKLRQIGRFLIEIRKHTKNVTDFFSIYYPKNNDATIAAAQSLAGLNEAGTGYKTPSLATAIGTLLKQIGKLCVSEWIKRENKERQTFVENYLHVLNEEYSTSVTRTALETQASKKRHTKVILPSNADIQKLQVYLRDAVRTNYAALNEKFSKQSWTKLAEATLISIQLFNRRRAGEIERIFIEDYLNHHKIDESTVGEAYTKFTAEEKKAALKYTRFTLRGKLARTVAVLLHKELQKSCQLLLKYRLNARVTEKNPYLFGIAGTLKGDYKYLRACELMRKFAVDCGAEKPETLRGTVLRKHIATMCIHFDLTDNEVSDLANFMGHADKIHKEHYRQPIISREILQISKLLEAVQGQDDDSGDESDDASNECEAGPSTLETIADVSDIAENREAADNSVTMSSSIQQGAHEMTLSDTEISTGPKAKKRRSTSPYGKCRRLRWSEKEIAIVRKTFGQSIAKETALPTIHEIQEMIAKHPGVFNPQRTMASIKTWVHNETKKQK